VLTSRSMSRIRTKQRENVFELAQQIQDTPPGLRGAVFSYRRATTRTYERMASAAVLLPGMDKILLDAHAPAHVVRWACWGKYMPNRILRMGLALYVRRELERVGQAESGLSWLLDCQKSTAEAIFIESSKGKATLDWIKASMYKQEYQAEDGGCSPRFWNELEKKLNQMPLDQFWAEIDRRVALKPKRNPPKKSRVRVSRPEMLPKKYRDMIRELAAYEAEQFGTKKGK